jgi:hypothetical protein
VTGRNQRSVGAKTTQTKIIAIMHKKLDGLRQRHSFVYHLSGLLMEKLPGMIRVRIAKQLSLTLSDDIY